VWPRANERFGQYALPQGCGKLCSINRTLQGMAMPSTFEALQAEVLRLSPADRAKLLDRLIASLDVDAEAEAAWDAVVDRREKELERGSSQAMPIEVAIARLEARFPA